MTGPDISREAVMTLAEHITRGPHEAWEVVCATTLLALRDALDAAGAEQAAAVHENQIEEREERMRAVAAEREACAQVADAFQTAHGEAIAKGIRARGEGGPA